MPIQQRLTKERFSGAVSWFNSAQGTGFHISDQPDIYWHLYDIQGEEKTLQDGDRVGIWLYQG